MQARWHLLVVVFILANISLKAQDNGGCNDCPAFNASGKIEVRGVKERIIGDLSQPISVRIENIIRQMTLEEKVAQLSNESDSIPRLNLPSYNYWNECLHGVARAGEVTVFPQAINLASTWDTLLVKRIASAISTEARLKYLDIGKGLTYWAPTINMARDPRWGRNEETYGEDPYLTSRLGVAFVKGLQGDHPNYLKTVATVKHFVANNQENDRFSSSSQIPTKQLYEYYFPAYEACVKEANVQSIMTAYNAFNGIPPSGSTWLLEDVLRKEWGFDGFVVSDCGAIGNLTSRKHYTAKNKIEAANQALAAGIATNCGDTYNDKEVIQAAKDGRLDMANLDNVCRTMLRMMFRNELFEKEHKEPLDWNKIYPGWNSDSHKEIARQSARESIVMLENKDDLLPLSKHVRTIAVLGPGADNLQPGDYTPKLRPGQLKSVLTGIKQAVGNQTKILYEQGCEFTGSNGENIPNAVKVAAQSDVVVLVLGDCSTSEATTDVYKTSGENHDYATLILPGRQQELLEAVCATGKPVVLLLQIGRPYNLTKESELCKAIIVNWLPGQEGGLATADVLFGDYNPAGRLPMTFPRHVGQLPLYYNFKTSGRRYEYLDLEYYPLYYFGYGLSYTSFEYSDLKVEERENGNIIAHVNVKNIGYRAGDEVVQLYVTDMYASVKTRITELKDFTRVHLRPGESKSISFELTPYELSLLNDNMDRVVEKGTFKILVGGVSPQYIAKDRIKDSLGYEDAQKGLSVMLEYNHGFAADFDLALSKVEDNLLAKQRTIWISVKNNGTLMDTGKVEMYVDGRKTGDKVHYELAPGEEKLIPFIVDKDSNQSVVFATKYKVLSI